MSVITIAGNDLKRLDALRLLLLAADTNPANGYRLRVTISDGGFKFAVNGAVWSPPIGEEMP